MTPLYASPSLPSLRPHHQFCRFSSVDVQPFVPQLLDVLLAAQNSPEHTVENDFLSCVVRVPSAHCVLCLIGVLPRSCESFHHYETSARWGVRQRSVEARRHPTRSRPKSEYPQLDQYVFERISCLVWFICTTVLDTVSDSIAVFEFALFPPFT